VRSDADDRLPDPGPSGPGSASAVDLAALLGLVARGNTTAFETVYDHAAGVVYGTVQRVLRDPAQSEEVAQEVLLEVWRTASQFDAGRGSAMGWVTTIAHRRAVDRIRAERRSAEREWRSAAPVPPDDDVVEVAIARIDQERVRRCLGTLTDLQRESVLLAYYAGYTYREVGQLLGVAVGTVKTRIRDGLIRLRDCLGVSA
jgi:RNA polymerase sigma-70 factor (ECF subfamily)